MKPFFSVTLATHNEAKNLARCLDSVVDIADEIVIVDGESTDDTTGIAASYKAVVIKTTNKLNFHINKQQANDHAQGTLILQIDADEVVDTDLKKEIVELIETLKNTKDIVSFEPKAWSIPRKNWYLGRFLTKGGQYPDRVTRLFIKGYAQLPQKNVHEQMQVDGQTKLLHGHLLHYGHPSFAYTVTKMNTYTSFEAERLFKEGVDLRPQTLFSFLCTKPLKTFISLYVRHKGFVDGFSGFLFALMSALHHPVTLLKLWEHYATRTTEA